MPTNRIKIIAYITDMSKEMNKMAVNNHSPLLALLLEMAAKEGRDIINTAKRNMNHLDAKQAHHRDGRVDRQDQVLSK